MDDLGRLNDWDKMGICSMSPTWHAAHYFKAPYSLKRLISMGLIEETMHEPSGKPDDNVPFRLIQLTTSGLAIKEQILASGFNPLADIKRRG